MNSKQQLQSWRAEWDLHKKLAALPIEIPSAESDSANSADGAGAYEVSASGFDLGRTLLEQMEKSIRPGLAASSAAGSAHDKSEVDVAVNGGERNVEPVLPLEIVRGSILHLYPGLDLSWQREVFVLVLDLLEGGEKALVAPFGPLPIPALESELATGLEDESLAVLCLWNRAYVSVELLRQSWYVAAVPEGLLGDIGSLVTSLETGDTLPDSLIDRVGPRLEHPEDPRQDYLDEEEGLLLHLQD